MQFTGLSDILTVGFTLTQTIKTMEISAPINLLIFMDW